MKEKIVEELMKRLEPVVVGAIKKQLGESEASEEETPTGTSAEETPTGEAEEKEEATGEEATEEAAGEGEAAGGTEEEEGTGKTDEAGETNTEGTGEGASGENTDAEEATGEEETVEKTAGPSEKDLLAVVRKVAAEEVGPIVEKILREKLIEMRVGTPRKGQTRPGGEKPPAGEETVALTYKDYKKLPKEQRNLLWKMFGDKLVGRRLQISKAELARMSSDGLEGDE